MDKSNFFWSKNIKNWEKMGCGRSRCCRPKQQVCFPVVPINPCQQFQGSYGGAPYGGLPY